MLQSRNLMSHTYDEKRFNIAVNKIKDEYFKNNNKIKKVILFGSRAKGNFKLNSDIDLCIDCNENYKGTIKEDIEDIIGVYSSDLVFIDSLNEEIEKQINRDGICIYSEGRL